MKLLVSKVRNKDGDRISLNGTVDQRKNNSGRHKLQQPNNRDKHILEALRAGHSMASVGRVYEISRQYVLQIKQRWPELAPKPKAKLKLKGGSKNGTDITLRSQGSRLPAAKRLHSYPPKSLVGE
tara:strand:+ start:73 stop:447 length:375 start_codon:yes stop_codon:yes gene_type:complete